MYDADHIFTTDPKPYYTSVKGSGSEPQSEIKRLWEGAPQQWGDETLYKSVICNTHLVYHNLGASRFLVNRTGTPTFSLNLWEGTPDNSKELRNSIGYDVTYSVSITLSTDSPLKLIEGSPLSARERAQAAGDPVIWAGEVVCAHFGHIKHLLRNAPTRKYVIANILVISQITTRFIYRKTLSTGSGSKLNVGPELKTKNVIGIKIRNNTGTRVESRNKTGTRIESGNKTGARIESRDETEIRIESGNEIRINSKIVHNIKDERTHSASAQAENYIL
ncbi:hypothetical protein EVAR_62563_1 [Eumeta japonica]|uniref:Uncharacterized protein n=1 Tax=Eumeta variegata TaxID=151549 RepID=A0A4C1YST0_EUMVA|nr:hypothetical protein EVAR_62563_1 [Eumeta japonica]